MKTIIITLEDVSSMDVDALTIGINQYICNFAKDNHLNMKVSDINYY